MVWEFIGWIIVLSWAASAFMVVIGHPVIDGLDAYTSRLTVDEARRRARLALINRWPVAPAARWSTRGEWLMLVMGLSMVLLLGRP